MVLSLSLSPSNPFVFEQESHSLIHSFSFIFQVFLSFQIFHSLFLSSSPSFSNFFHSISFFSFILFLPLSFILHSTIFHSIYDERRRKNSLLFLLRIPLKYEERRVKVNTEYLLLFSVSKSRSLIIISCERKREKERLLLFFF